MRPVRKARGGAYRPHVTVERRRPVPLPFPPPPCCPRLPAPPCRGQISNFEGSPWGQISSFERHCPQTVMQRRPAVTELRPPTVPARGQISNFERSPLGSDLEFPGSPWGQISNFEPCPQISDRPGVAAGVRSRNFERHCSQQ